LAISEPDRLPGVQSTQAGLFIDDGKSGLCCHSFLSCVKSLCFNSTEYATMAKKALAALLALGLSLAAPAAYAGSRIIDGAMGAGAGAIVGGPVGAVAGGVIGYTAGPTIDCGLHGGCRHRHYHHYHHHY
jgi:hypothetical protein